MSGRHGSHTMPPERLPGESLQEYLEVIRTCPVLLDDPYPADKVVYPRAPKSPPAPLRTIDCEHCGKRFTTRSGRQVYCGTSCVAAAVAARKRAERRLDMVPCPHCGRAFRPKLISRATGRRQQVCSMGCWRAIQQGARVAS